MLISDIKPPGSEYTVRCHSDPAVVGATPQVREVRSELSSLHYTATAGLPADGHPIALILTSVVNCKREFYLLEYTFQPNL